MDDLEQLLAEVEALKAREARIASEAGLMWLVIGALYNGIVDDGRCVIEADGATADVIAEIVNRVEGRA